MSDLQVIYDASGPVPQTATELRQQVVAIATSLSPGISTELPGSLIEDMVSTSVGALMVCDQARVDLINSCSPYGANLHLLMHLGAIYGIARGVGSNTSVSVVFIGSPGFVVPRGFIVSDGNYQYVVQNNAVIPANGQSASVYCLATIQGNWAVPAGTVTQIITSVPVGINLSVTNIYEGVPGLDAQTNEDYRSQVMQAGMFAVQGTPDALRTALSKVSGVHSNLVSYRQISVGIWAVIVGGGDPYEVARAIYESIPDTSVLTVDVNNPSGHVPASETVTILDYPDYYKIPFIIPSSQSVDVIITWNTRNYNVVDPRVISELSVTAIVNYISSISVGTPINIYQLQSIFQKSILSVISVDQISLIKISVAIDGVVVEPDPNTGLISGDYYKYFTTDASHITVQKYDGTN